MESVRGGGADKKKTPKKTLKAYIQNLVKNNPVVSEKKNKFKFSYVNALGQGQEMTLSLTTNLLSFPE